MSVNDLFDEVLQLSPSSRAALVEKIVESIAADIDPAIERSHLEAIAKRRQETVTNPERIVPGDEVLQRARALLPK